MNNRYGATERGDHDTKPLVSSSSPNTPTPWWKRVNPRVFYGIGGVSVILNIALIAALATNDGGDSGGSTNDSAAMMETLDVSATVSGCINVPHIGLYRKTCDGIAYTISAPNGCEVGCPLVFDVHGGFGDAALQNDSDNIRQFGNERGYIVVHPDNPLEQWNAGSDQTAVLAVFKEVAMTYQVDPFRVHVTGFSQGGFMTWNLLCTGYQFICSVAPMSSSGVDDWGNGYGETCFSVNAGPFVDRSILYMTGELDTIAPFSNYETAVNNVLRHYGMLTSDPGVPVDTKDDSYSWTRWINNEGITFETVTHTYTSDLGGGHCVPSLDAGGTKQNCDGEHFNAGELIMDFFEANPCICPGGSVDECTALCPPGSPQFTRCISECSSTCPDEDEVEVIGEPCLTEPLTGYYFKYCNKLGYYITVPDGCEAGGCPLILDSHGGLEDAALLEQTQNLASFARDRGYIVMQPDKASQFWNAFGDLDKLDFALHELVDTYQVDRSRIHVTGFSQGGYNAWNLLCRSSDLICSISAMGSTGLDSAETGWPEGFGTMCFNDGTGGPAIDRSIFFMMGEEDHVSRFENYPLTLADVLREYNLKSEDGVRLPDLAENSTRIAYTTANGINFHTLVHQYESTAFGGHCTPNLDAGSGVGVCNGEYFNTAEVVLDFFDNNPCLP